ncbi:MAG: preprotein translocase subunit YajC [Bacteroidota bacterium]|jgi:preprotein translocase subunit YajC
MQPPQGDGQGGGGGMLGLLLPLVLIFVVFYFFIIRPQQKRQKERQSLLSALKKGDKVIAAGGLHGTVIGIEEKTVLLQVADNVKIKCERSSVITILREAE